MTRRRKIGSIQIKCCLLDHKEFGLILWKNRVLNKNGLTELVSKIIPLTNVWRMDSGGHTHGRGKTEQEIIVAFQAKGDGRDWTRVQVRLRLVRSG